MSKTIRPISICIFLSSGRILATEGFDDVTKKKFFRPVGGGIEFGETSQEALIREIKEEFGAEIKSLDMLGIFENIFTYQGQAGHEIVYVYNAEFSDDKFYSMEKITVLDEKNSYAVWLKIEDLINNKITIYPIGLTELIKNNRDRTCL